MAAIACFAFIIFGVTFANADESEATANSVPLPVPSLQETKEALDSPNAVSLNGLATDAAAELPHSDLGRSEALELIESVFKSELESPAGIYDELHPSRFLSDYAAVVPSGVLPQPIGQEVGQAPAGAGPNMPMVLESALPLRTDNPAGVEEPVDLSLQRAEGELQPANPLTEVGVPTEIGEGVSLPSVGVTIELPEAPDDRAASNVEQSFGFYPNIAEDTDFVVAPMPTGVETLTDIRSAAAPRTETFHLSMPPGASLRADAEGGAEIVQDASALVAIPAPSAIDAAGEEVPVSLEVSGDSIVLTLAPGEATAYPVLLDPVFLNEEWSWWLHHDSLAAWSSSTSAESYRPVPYAFFWGPNYPGLDLTSGFPGSAPYGTAANWLHAVPRYSEDIATYKAPPTSWIYELYAEGVMFLNHGNSSAWPALILGLVDPNNGWANYGVHYGTQGEMTSLTNHFTFLNEYAQTGTKLAQMSLITYEAEAGAKLRDTFIGNAVVVVADADAPEVLELKAPQQWMNTAPVTIGYTFKDGGLGVRSAMITAPGASSAHPGWGADFACAGTTVNPCPRLASSTEAGRPALTYNPAELPTGIDKLTVTVGDPTWATGHVVPQTAKVNVDHAAPTLSLSGSLTEQATLGATRPQYTLKYAAADGSEEAPTYISAVGSEGVAAGQFKHPADVALDPSGNVWVSDQNNNRIEKENEKGEFTAYGSLGSGSGQLNHPTGIEADSNGNVWVADTGNNRIEKFNPEGKYVTAFGSAGSTNGKLSAPQGIAIDTNGSVWVADTGNNRVEKFSSSGTFLAAFGSTGSGAGQLSEPTALDIGPGGKVWVADTGNNRIEEFSEAGEYIAAYGGLGSGNGQLSHPDAIDVDTWGNIWVGDQGNGRIEQFSERGEYLGKFGAAGSGPGQFSFSAPIGLTTSRAGKLWVTDSGSNRIESWTAPQGTQSGIRSVAVKVDSKVVAEPKLACETGGCPLAGEWTLQSGSYSAGSHAVEVIATDGVGLTATQKQTIEVQRDTTNPSLEVGGELANAPEGWVQQESYKLNAAATDTAGFGVTSLAFKIDGATVASSTQSCTAGSCEATLSKSVSMASYSGGSHQAEVIAIDGAGNSKVTPWTINVDPEGHISSTEATATLKAVEETSEANLVGDSKEEAIGGSGPGLGVESSEGELVAAGTRVPLTIEPTANGGFTAEVPEASALQFCAPEESTETSEEELEENEEEAGSEEVEEACDESILPEGNEEGMVSIQVVPLGVKEGASNGNLVAENAVVSANTTTGVDTVTRPLVDGGMSFASIRDDTAPEEYSWRVELSHGQELKLIDDQHAEVYYNDDTPAFSITAESAHDAVGTTVPTMLSVKDGDVVTLTVSFKAGHEGKPFVYPIVGGTGWEGGFRTIEISLGEPSALDAELELLTQSTLIVGAPEPVPVYEGGGASASATGEMRRPFVRSICGHNFDWYEGVEGPKHYFADACGNAFRPVAEPGEQVIWRGSMRGAFIYAPGDHVRHNNARACTQDDPGTSKISEYVMAAYYQCKFGPKTSDGNGGVHAEAGHYLRAQAHWILLHRGQCEGRPNACPPDVYNPWIEEEKPLEMHLWPSGNIDITVGAGHPGAGEGL